MRNSQKKAWPRRRPLKAGLSQTIQELTTRTQLLVRPIGVYLEWAEALYLHLATNELSLGNWQSPAGLVVNRCLCYFFEEPYTSGGPTPC